MRRVLSEKRQAQLESLLASPTFRRSPVLALLRLIHWRLRTFAEGTVILALPRWNARIEIPAQWTGISKLIFLEREDYEAELAILPKLLEGRHMVVDVGANLGIYSIAASRILDRSGRVIAVEPASETYSRLLDNIAMNAIENVQAFQVAVSDQTGVTKLYHYPDPGRNRLGAASTTRVAASYELVDTWTLPELLDTAGVHKVDLIKLDVEGSEELVLKGAKPILERDRPLLIFESNRQAAEGLGLNADGPWELLRSLGYEFLGVAPDQSLKALNQPPEFGNVIAVHMSTSEQ